MRRSVPSELSATSELTARGSHTLLFTFSVSKLRRERFEYCEQLKFENDVLRAELDLFAKKAQASARKGSQTPRNRS